MYIFIGLFFSTLWAQKLRFKLELTNYKLSSYLFIYILLFFFKKTIFNHTFESTSSLNLYLPKIGISFPLFLSIALISKLKKKANYKEWRNAISDFCKINGLWQYMLSQIIEPKAFSPLKKKKLAKKTKKIYDIKLM